MVPNSAHYTKATEAKHVECTVSRVYAWKKCNYIERDIAATFGQKVLKAMAIKLATVALPF